MSTLTALSASLADATSRAGRSLVAVHARRRIPASGVLWRPGVIVATHHTVHLEQGIAVTLPDGSRGRASVVGRDAGTDLVALRLEEGSPAGGAEPAAGAPEPIRTGQLALALGRPGTRVTAALGVVADVGPAWRSWQGGELDRFVRLDVAIQDGFSGGPLVDGEGRVAGINTSALARAAALTIPTATVDRVLDRLLAGRTRRGWLGIGAQPVRLPDAARRRLADEGVEQGQGLLLVSVEPGSPAERAGLLLGDVLLALGAVRTEDVTDVLAAVAPERVGDTLSARVLRGGEPRELSVTIEEQPERGRR